MDSTSINNLLSDPTVVQQLSGQSTIDGQATDALSMTSMLGIDGMLQQLISLLPYFTLAGLLYLGLFVAGMVNRWRTRRALFEMRQDIKDIKSQLHMLGLTQKSHTITSGSRAMSVEQFDQSSDAPSANK